MWEEQIQGGDTPFKGEVSVEGKFGSLRKGSVSLGCRVGKTGETEGKGWQTPEATPGLWGQLWCVSVPS